MDILDVVTDLEASEKGAWFPITDDCKIKIAEWGNKKHKKYLREMYNKHGRKIEAGALNDNQADKLMVPQWVHIIRDWEGITKKGEVLPFNEDNLLELAGDKRFDNFFKKIESISKEEENFREANILEMGEDLPTT